MERKKARDIVVASLPRRALCALSDLAFALFGWFTVFGLCQIIFTSTPAAKSYKQQMLDYCESSGLYYIDDDGNATAYEEYSSYSSYQDMLVNYYTVFLTNDVPDAYKTNYDIYWYNVHILGLEDTKGIYSEDTIAEPSKSTGPLLFEYQVIDGETQVDSLGVPLSSFYNDSGELTTSAEASLLTFFYSTSTASTYYNALADLFYQDFYYSIYSSYTRLSTTFPFAIGVGVSALVFYFVIPLVFRNGQTLCKKFFRFAVIRNDGYAAKRGFIVLRQLPTILLAIILAIFLKGMYAIMILSLLLFISYMVAIFTPKHQALHDFVAFTMVVDDLESVYFASKEEEEKAEQELNDHLEEIELARERVNKELEEEKRVEISSQPYPENESKEKVNEPKQD